MFDPNMTLAELEQLVQTVKNLLEGGFLPDAVAVECGVGQGDETVSVWRDFAQFYERMEHHILQANAETFGFPLPILRVAVSAYKMQRVLVLHGIHLKGSGSWMCHGHLPGQTVLLACVGQCCAPASSCLA